MNKRIPILMTVLMTAAAALLVPGCGSGGGGGVGVAAANNDLDGDGVIDSLDAFPNDPAASVDTDGDGKPDAWNPGATPAQIAASLLVVDDDDDNDGVPDGADAFPLNRAETVDTDGDGVGNNADIDDDNDGVADGQEDFPLDPTETEDTDADGIGNNADTDDDGDGLPDLTDPFPLIAFLPPGVAAPEPVNLGLFLKNTGAVDPVTGFPVVASAARDAAIQLGKALYWDMNVGSDGIQSCATCHFSAGADSRTVNQVSPGLLKNQPNTTFDVKLPNQALAPGDFPLHQRSPADQQASAVTNDQDDIVSSQGVFGMQFVDIVLGSPFETVTSVADPVFQAGGANTRRVEPRNTPSVINAVFNFTNYWDGRARNIFNGVNPSGELDETGGVLVQAGGIVQGQRERVRIPDASLASQAMGPPLSEFEMSAAGRTFPKIGKKLLFAGLRPLSQQVVAPTDSRLGPLAAAPTGLIELAAGENAYVTLIKRAFQEKYWNSPGQHIVFSGGVPSVVNSPVNPNLTNQYTQMEANFSLFFGLAMQLYEATLVSDDSKFDRVNRTPLGQPGGETFTAEEEAGRQIFFGAGNCTICHTGPLLTVHSVNFIRGGILPQPPGFLPIDAVEGMPMSQGLALYDAGLYNIGVTRTTDDLSRGGDSPFLNPLTDAPYPLSHTRLGLLKQQGLLPPGVAQFVPNAPVGLTTRSAVDGAFKTPGLRNVELTGPYFHNGGASTLQQVMEFYARGTNFPLENIENLDPIGEIGLLKIKANRDNLVQFMLTLTDERVRREQAPFDHPSLRIPAGDGVAGGPETMIDIPAVGAGGGAPLKPFLELDPLQP